MSAISTRTRVGLASAFEVVRTAQAMRVVGKVAGVRGLTLSVEELPLPVGSLVAVGPSGFWKQPRVEAASHAHIVYGEVVALAQDRAVVMLLGDTVGIRAGDDVVGEHVAQVAPVGRRLLGRCVDGLGRPIDAKGPIGDVHPRALNPEPIAALRRRSILKPMHTGVRALDLMTTIGRGQRVGIFAGPGVGKSTLLGTIARASDADVNVIALIGERGREVRDFLEHSLGPEGKRSRVMCYTIRKLCAASA